MAVRALPATLTWRWAAFLPLAIAPILVAWLILPTVGAQFGLIDDHEIIALIGADGRLWPWELPGLSVDYGIGDGRFRPGYYAIRGVEAMMWDTAPSLWYATRLVLALATVAAVVALAWPLGALPLAALALMPFAGPQAEAWYRLGPQETYGLPLIIAGLAFLRWSRFWPAVALLIGAGLMKESFAVTLPIIAAGWWWAARRWSPPLVSLTVGSVILCFAVAVVQLFGDFYGMDRTPETVTLTMVTLIAGLTPTAWFIPGLFGLRLPLLVGIIAVVLSQAVVYGGFGDWLSGRYYIPAVVALVVVAAAGFRRVLYPSLVAVAMIAFMLPSLVMQHRSAEHWAASSRQFQAWLRTIDAHPGPLVIHELPGNAEPALSVRRYLGERTAAGPCADVIFTPETTGTCSTTFLIEGAP